MSTTSTDPRALVLDRIKELPPLPMVVHELMAVMNDTECSGEEVNRILSSDQALASKVLRLVNSSFYGLPGRVSTIPRAVVILGHAALLNLATGLVVADSLGQRLPPARRRVFWQHALATGAGAEVIARQIGLPEPEEAFIAGLLHDIGHLILMLALPDEHAGAVERGVLGDVEQERTSIGLDHCRAGRQLLQHWKLPASLLECVRLHHAGDSCRADGGPHLLTVVALADRLSRVLAAPGEGQQVEDDIVELAATLGLAPAAVLDLVPAVQARILQARSFLKAAEIDEATGTSLNQAAGRPAVIVSGQPARQEWLTALARFHGLAPRDVRDWLADASPDPGTVMLCDSATLDPTLVARLRPLLARHGGHLCVIGGSEGADCRTNANGRVISLAFSEAELGL